MKRTLRVLPDAETELHSAALWYEEKRRGLGIEFIAVLDKALQSVLENPEACPRLVPLLVGRRTRCARTPQTQTLGHWL